MTADDDDPARQAPDPRVGSARVEPTLVYRVLRGVLRVALRAHYTRLEVHGAERVPAAGPLLVLANHHNGLVDPMLVIACSERPIRYISKSTLFQIPVLGFFLRQLGCIPAYRRQDIGYAKEKNAELYAAVGRALAEGGAVGIFPEGRSHVDPTLGELKHGASRMALEAEAAHGFRLGLALELVGIHFDRTRGWRGKALVHFAEPVTIADLRQAWVTDREHAIRSLTARSFEGLRALVLDAGRDEFLDLVAMVERFEVLDRRAPDMQRSFEHRKRLLESYRRLHASHTAELDDVLARLRDYRGTLAALGVRDGFVTEDHSPARALSFALRHTAILVFGCLPYALGVALNVVPYAVARVAARASGREADMRVTVGLLVGIFAFPIWYALALWLVWALMQRPLAWTALLVCGPWLGLYAAWWLERWRRTWRAAFRLWLTVREPGCRKRLRALRADIVARVERIVALERAEQPAPGP